MQAAIFLPRTFFLALFMLLQQGGNPTIQGTFPPPQPARPSLPNVDGPPTVVRGEPQPRINPAKVKEEANQLAKLAQSIPPDVDKATKGQLPQDLVTRLKQIEKLSKQLRRDISP
jgi:cell division septal protein FtsQ